LITSRQWHAYEEALKRSKAQWAEENKRLKNQNQRLPTIKIGDAVWGDYAPHIDSLTED